MRHRFALVFVAYALAGCMPEQMDSHAASPADGPTGSSDATERSVSYAIPSELPGGEVSISPMEIEDRTIRLRMIVSNYSEHLWTVDASEQRLDLGSDALDPDSTWTVEIAPGATRFLDIVFPLPEGFDVDSPPRLLAAVWTVHTDRRTVTARTAFERVRVVPWNGNNSNSNANSER